MTLFPARAYPPGHHVKKEMDARSITLDQIEDEEFRNQLDGVIHRQEPITQDIAEKLYKLLNITPGSWLRLEENFRLWQAQKAIKDAYEEGKNKG